VTLVPESGGSGGRQPPGGSPERIAIESDADVVVARQRARSLAIGLDMPSTDQTLLATAISEIARNITTYANGGRGEVLIELVRDARGRRGVKVVARDEGPGIEDLERALTDGYTTGGGLGLGLPGARRLVDEFDIETAPGKGTTVTLVKWARGA
jgi:serine/threonine-protein kinase RsbT